MSESTETTDRKRGRPSGVTYYSDLRSRSVTAEEISNIPLPPAMSKIDALFNKQPVSSASSTEELPPLKLRKVVPATDTTRGFTNDEFGTIIYNELEIYHAIIIEVNAKFITVKIKDDHQNKFFKNEKLSNLVGTIDAPLIANTMCTTEIRGAHAVTLTKHVRVGDSLNIGDIGSENENWKAGTFRVTKRAPNHRCLAYVNPIEPFKKGNGSGLQYSNAGISFVKMTTFGPNIDNLDSEENTVLALSHTFKNDWPLVGAFDFVDVFCTVIPRTDEDKRQQQSRYIAYKCVRIAPELVAQYVNFNKLEKRNLFLDRFIVMKKLLKYGEFVNDNNARRKQRIENVVVTFDPTTSPMEMKFVIDNRLINKINEFNKLAALQSGTTFKNSDLIRATNPRLLKDNKSKRPVKIAGSIGRIEQTSTGTCYTIKLDRMSASYMIKGDHLRVTTDWAIAGDTNVSELKAQLQLLNAVETEMATLEHEEQVMGSRSNKLKMLYNYLGIEKSDLALDEVGQDEVVIQETSQLNPNLQQKRVIKTVLDNLGIMMIQGQPGVGKSVTIAAIIQGLCKRGLTLPPLQREQLKIWVGAKSNKAVMVLAKDILERGAIEVIPIRFTAHSKIDDTEYKTSIDLDYLCNHPEENTTSPEGRREQAEFKAAFEKLRDIFVDLQEECQSMEDGEEKQKKCGELIKAQKRLDKAEEDLQLCTIRLRNPNVYLGTGACTIIHKTLREAKFNNVLCDESGQLGDTEMLSLIMIMANGAERFVVIGDTKQLSAYSSLTGAAGKLAKTSAMQRLEDNGLVQSWEMTESFRSAPAIMHIYSEFFYDSRLTCGRTAEEMSIGSTAFPFQHRLFPILYIDMESADILYGLKKRINEDQVTQCITLVQYLIQSEVYRSGKRILIITPYISMVLRIQQALIENNLGQLVNQVMTFDASQGSEDSCVILVTVRCSMSAAQKPKGLLSIKERRQAVGFMEDRARATVALSRAQHCLFIIGHSDTLKHISFYDKLYQYCKANDALTTDLQEYVSTFKHYNHEFWYNQEGERNNTCKGPITGVSAELTQRMRTAWNELLQIDTNTEDNAQDEQLSAMSSPRLNETFINQGGESRNQLASASDPLSERRWSPLALADNNGDSNTEANDILDEIDQLHDGAGDDGILDEFEQIQVNTGPSEMDDLDEVQDNADCGSDDSGRRTPDWDQNSIDELIGSVEELNVD